MVLCDNPPSYDCMCFFCCVYMLYHASSLTALPPREYTDDRFGFHVRTATFAVRKIRVTVLSAPTTPS